MRLYWFRLFMTAVFTWRNWGNRYVNDGLDLRLVLPVQLGQFSLNQCLPTFTGTEIGHGFIFISENLGN